MLGRNDSNLLQSNDNNSSYPTGVELPHGKARIHIIKGKELIKADMIGKSDPYVVLSYGKQKQKTKELEPKLGDCIDEIHKHPLQDMCLRITDTVPEDKLPDASWDLSLLLTNTHYYATNVVLSDQEKEPGWDTPILSIGMVNGNIGAGTEWISKPSYKKNENV